MGEMIDIRTNYAYTIFRGINEARQYSWQNNTNTEIIDAASAFCEDDKCELTVALEDFSDKFTSFHGKNNSNISADDCKKKGFSAWLENMGWKKPSYSNIYETPAMQDYMKTNGNIFQGDIFDQARAADNGIKFAKEGDDIYESALNFAKADINAIEDANSKAYIEAKKNGKLEKGEISTYADMEHLYSDFAEYMDLDGNSKSISAEEYASFLLVADGCFKDDSVSMGRGYNSSQTDGLITNDEALAFKNLTNEEVKRYAQSIYDAHYKK